MHVAGSAPWASLGCLSCSSPNALSSSAPRGKAGVWVSRGVSLKANLSLKVAFLLKNVRNGPGRPEQLLPGGDGGDKCLLQKAVSTPSCATAIHKPKNKSITRVNELKMSVFKMYREEKKKKHKNC